MHVLSESVTRILVSGFYTVEELQSRDESDPPHMNSIISCFWVAVLRWLTLICFERIYWLHNHPSIWCVEKKGPKIFNAGRDLFAVVLKFLWILTAQLFSFHFFLVFSFFLFLLLFLALLFGILFSFQSPYHCFLILTVARVRGSGLFTLLWRT